MLKVLQRIFLVLLAAGIIGLGITAIVKSQTAIREADAAIAQADEFLRWCYQHNKGGR